MYTSIMEMLDAPRLKQRSFVPKKYPIILFNFKQSCTVDQVTRVHKT